MRLGTFQVHRERSIEFHRTFFQFRIPMIIEYLRCQLTQWPGLQSCLLPNAYDHWPRGAKGSKLSGLDQGRETTRPLIAYNWPFDLYTWFLILLLSSRLRVKRRPLCKIEPVLTLIHLIFPILFRSARTYCTNITVGPSARIFPFPSLGTPITPDNPVNLVTLVTSVRVLIQFRRPF